jgi:diguanylate cyclase (GGDEF)-like protein
MAIIAEIRVLWKQIDIELSDAAQLPVGGDTDAALDPFHEDIDEALSLLTELIEATGIQIADEIAAMRGSEQLQLVVGLATLGAGIASASLLVRWVRRTITSRLGLLEHAAIRIGSDDLSHRIQVGGDDELSRVGEAFNTMASTLESSRLDLQRQAYHDPLTGLANRELFMERIGHAKDRARRRSVPFSLMYLDLDGFKFVNDSRGHHVGDDVLQVAATRMASCLRTEDTLARLGGDEFGVLLEETGAAAAAEVADRVVHAVGDTPFSGHDLSIGVSVGITTGGSHDDDDRLLREADAAMYSAKASGGSAWHAFDPVTLLDGVRTQSMRTELQRAAEQHEFVIHYQPVVRLETGAIEAVEALVRWQHPERGLLPPSAFLDAATATGHILFIDNWVMHEACRQVKRWQTSVPGAAGLTACVNISATQLRHPGLASSVVEALRASGLRAQDLVVELTEGSLVHDMDAAARELQQLRDLGVRIALDDFGTGYSALTHLLRFPVDIIKVDRSFVSEMDNGGQGSDLAEALVTFGRTMGLQTISEGIEQPHQLGLLRSARCELGQGYLFARPMEAEELGQILNRSITIAPRQPTEAPIS